MSLSSRESSKAAVPTAAAFIAVVALAAAGTLALPAAPSGAVDHHGATVRVVKSKKYGKILVDAAGDTLYMLTSTKGSPLTCTGSCTGIWPPLVAKGKVRGGKGVVAKKLSTVARGSERQVVYHGHPLYKYAGDSGRGQANGEGIKSFGGTWYVLSKSGKPVTGSGTTTTSGGSYGGGY